MVLEETEQIKKDTEFIFNELVNDEKIKAHFTVKNRKEDLEHMFNEVLNEKLMLLIEETNQHPLYRYFLITEDLRFEEWKTNMFNRLLEAF